MRLSKELVCFTEEGREGGGGRGDRGERREGGREEGGRRGEGSINSTAQLPTTQLTQNSPDAVGSYFRHVQFDQIGGREERPRLADLKEVIVVQDSRLHSDHQVGERARQPYIEEAGGLEGEGGGQREGGERLQTQLCDLV